MAYTTEHTVSTGGFTELWSTTSDESVGPIEWTIITDEDISLKFTGVFPHNTNITIRATDTPLTFTSPTRGWQTVSAGALTTQATVKLIPTIL